MLQSNRSINDSIRQAACGMFRQEFPKFVVDGIALAIHPWPDVDLSDEEVTELMSELLPRQNIHHVSAIEIAIDRLLRFANCLENLGRVKLASDYLETANCLENARELVASNVLEGLIVNPIGIDPGALVSDSTPMENSTANCFASDDQLQLTIAQMFGAAETTGSFDLGEMFGGEKTEVTVEQLADYFGAENPLQKFDRFVNSLDSRDKDIFVSRICELTEPNTLEMLARQWSVSRERIRQREKKLLEKSENEIGEVFNRFCLPFSAQFKGKVVKSKFLVAGMMSLTSSSQLQKAACGFVMFVSGPWRMLGEWAFHASMGNRVVSLYETFQSIRKEHGYVSNELFETFVGELFLNSKQQAEYLADAHDLVQVGSFWAKNSSRSLVATALRSLGKPSTKEEISALVEVEVTRIGNILSSLDDVKRADKLRWGYPEWLDDEYTGIVDEIVQRIDEEGGEVSVHQLVSELPEKFGVSEGSVRSYLATDAFLVKSGIVSKADTSSFVPKDPNLVNGHIEINGSWGQVLKLSKDHFEGYSLAVSFDLAYANGIRPNDSLLVAVDGTDQEGTIIWRPTSTNRRVDVGRISRALKQLQLSPGDHIAIVVSPGKIHIRLAEEELLETDLNASFDEDDELIFGDEDNHSLLSDVIPETRGENE